MRKGGAGGQDAPFKILTLDGGGIRGAFSASVLAEIEAQSGCRVLDHFDLIVGTSTGGIIALGLAAGLTAAEIRDFYEQDGPQIFGRGALVSAWRSLLGIVRPKHDPSGLRAALAARFRALTMWDLKTRVVIPAFSATAGRIRLFKTRHEERITRDHTRTLVEVALATSAAPRYLPSHVTETGERYIDGGIWANNPVAVGVIEAVGYLRIPPRLIRVLSVGTTVEPFHVSPWVVGRGLIGLMTGALAGPSVEMFMASQTTAAQAQAKTLLQSGDAIVRIDVPVRPGRFTLDRAADLRELRALGSDTSTHFMPLVRRQFFEAPAAYAYAPLPLPGEPGYASSKRGVGDFSPPAHKKARGRDS